MYESPITLCQQIQTDLTKQFENDIFEAVLKSNVIVDREELIKALNYDRDQYKTGYEDGYRAAMDEIKNMNYGGN